MVENKNIDMDEIVEEISSRLEDMIEDALVDQVEDAVTNAVQDVFEEALSTSLSRFEFVLSDGTLIRPRKQMQLLSPDKTKLLLCYGGLRVDGTSLLVQTRASSWDCIAHYNSKEEAVETLIKVKNAINSNTEIFEL